MISLKDRENLIREMKKYSSSSEDERIIYSLAHGLYYEKTFKEIVSHYGLNKEIAEKYWEKMGANNYIQKEKEKRPRKKNTIMDYLKENIGNEKTAKDIVNECNVSLPTAYKFINENIGWFQKTGRGKYIIIDANQKRKEEKENAKHHNMG